MPDDDVKEQEEQLGTEERPAGEAGTGAEESLRTTPEGDGERAADDTGEKAIPYSRFKTVNERAQAYAKYGKPEELAAKLERLEAYERAREQVEREEQERQWREGYDPEAAERAARFRQLSDEAYGPGHSERQDRLAELEEMERQRHGQEGMNAMRSLLEDHNLPTDEATLSAYEDRLTTILNKQENAALNRAFWNPATQREAIQEAFKLDARVTNAALRAQGAMALEDLAKRRASNVSSARAATSPTPVVNEFKPKSRPGTIEYEREWKNWESDQIDRVYDAMMDSGRTS